MNEEKQGLFNSLHDGLNFISTQGQMDDFITQLSKNGLKIVSICECEPFQVCKECSKKLEWFPLSKLKENNKEYWLIDKNNIVGVGHQKEGFLIVYNLEKTPENFDKPVMFAEIKPPFKYN